jgi:hypothetical protein
VHDVFAHDIQYAICRTADMQREQRIREITLLQNRIAHATRELETSNQLEMERVAVELELRRKCVLMAAVHSHLPQWFTATDTECNGCLQ